jgi:hypothetical protein
MEGWLLFGTSTFFYLQRKVLFISHEGKKLEIIADLPSNQSLVKRVEMEEPQLLAAKRDVEPTPIDVLGPFYVIGAPFRAKLCPIDATGRKLLIRGTLRDSFGKFIPFTVIDFWQVSTMSLSSFSPSPHSLGQSSK